MGRVLSGADCGQRLSAARFETGFLVSCFSFYLSFTIFFQIAVLHQFVDFCLDGWVSVYEFEVFALSFGPLTGCINRVLTAFDSGVLAGYISSFEANAALAGKGPGSYLVRFSKSNPGAFAVTFVDSKSRVKHCLLYNARPHGVTLKDPPDVFPSLQDFVKAHRSRLQVPLAAQVR